MKLPKDIDNPPFPGKRYLKTVGIDEKKFTQAVMDLDAYSKELSRKDPPRGKFKKVKRKVNDGTVQTVGLLEANPTALVGIAARLLHTALTSYGYYAFDEYTGILDEDTEEFGVALLKEPVKHK